MADNEEVKAGAHKQRQRRSLRTSNPPTIPAAMASTTQFATLILEPLNKTFTLKAIELPEGVRVRIGRHTTPKTAPSASNGYFDSKVLSRTHAEVWSEGGKVFIKDLKSSNGTFIDDRRLSMENLESEPFELRTGQQLHLGTDIKGEDDVTVIHHKVKASVKIKYYNADKSSQETRRKERPERFTAVLSHLQAAIQETRDTSNEIAGVQAHFNATAANLDKKSGFVTDEEKLRLKRELASLQAVHEDVVTENADLQLRLSRAQNKANNKGISHFDAVLKQIEGMSSPQSSTIVPEDPQTTPKMSARCISSASDKPANGSTDVEVNEASQSKSAPSVEPYNAMPVDPQVAALRSQAAAVAPSSPSKMPSIMQLQGVLNSLSKTTKLKGQFSATEAELDKTSAEIEAMRQSEQMLRNELVSKSLDVEGPPGSRRTADRPTPSLMQQMGPPVRRGSVPITQSQREQNLVALARKLAAEEIATIRRQLEEKHLQIMAKEKEEANMKDKLVALMSQIEQSKTEFREHLEVVEKEKKLATEDCVRIRAAFDEHMGQCQSEKESLLKQKRKAEATVVQLRSNFDAHVEKCGVEIDTLKLQIQAGRNSDSDSPLSLAGSIMEERDALIKENQQLKLSAAELVKVKDERDELRRELEKLKSSPSSGSERAVWKLEGKMNAMEADIELLRTERDRARRELEELRNMSDKSSNDLRIECNTLKQRAQEMTGLYERYRQLYEARNPEEHAKAIEEFQLGAARDELAKKDRLIEKLNERLTGLHDQLEREHREELEKERKRMAQQVEQEVNERMRGVMQESSSKAGCWRHHRKNYSNPVKDSELIEEDDDDDIDKHHGALGSIPVGVATGGLPRRSWTERLRQGGGISMAVALVGVAVYTIFRRA